MSDFEAELKELSLRLFEKIPSQSTDDDKRSLLACQLAMRDIVGEYNYLEIGSYLGGSIQPHLVDPNCTRIFSIDKRPAAQPDERGFEWRYNNNSTARMLEKLSDVSGDVSKITTIDGDTREIDPAMVDDKIELCFIDGEHTDEASIADFEFCSKILDGRGVIMFHDSHITYLGIEQCLEQLDRSGVAFKAYVLPSVLFVVEIGDIGLHKHPVIASMLTENHKSYLFALRDNDKYRRFANRFPFGTIRRMMLKVRGGNISE